MTEDDKREIEDQLFRRLQSRAIVIGVPAIITLFLAFASLTKEFKELR